MNEPFPPTTPPTPKSSALAIWSLVLGILSLTCFWLFTAIPAVICGHMAVSRIKRSGGLIEGRGLALAGMITGYVSIGLSIFIIPMMLAIAIPNFVKARQIAQQNLCINNLRQIDAAKTRWSLEKNQTNGAPAVDAEIQQFLSHPLVCPAGGTYTYGPVGTLPTCSIPHHQLPED
jgi:hypothetical protein